MFIKDEKSNLYLSSMLFLREQVKSIPYSASITLRKSFQPKKRVEKR